MGGGGGLRMRIQNLPAMGRVIPFLHGPPLYMYFKEHSLTVPLGFTLCLLKKYHGRPSPWSLIIFFRMIFLELQ